MPSGNLGLVLGLQAKAPTAPVARGAAASPAGSHRSTARGLKGAAWSVDRWKGMIWLVWLMCGWCVADVWLVYDKNFWTCGSTYDFILLMSRLLKWKSKPKYTSGWSSLPDGAKNGEIGLILLICLLTIAKWWMNITEAGTIVTNTPGISAKKANFQVQHAVFWPTNDRARTKAWPESRIAKSSSQKSLQCFPSRWV